MGQEEVKKEKVNGGGGDIVWMGSWNPEVKAGPRLGGSWCVVCEGQAEVAGTGESLWKP